MVASLVVEWLQGFFVHYSLKLFALSLILLLMFIIIQLE